MTSVVLAREASRLEEEGVSLSINRTSCAIHLMSCTGEVSIVATRNAVIVGAEVETAVETSGSVITNNDECNY